LLSNGPKVAVMYKHFSFKEPQLQDYGSGLMFGRVILQLLLGYSVPIGHQREQNYTEIVLKHVFQITLLHLPNT